MYLRTCGNCKTAETLGSSNQILQITNPEIPKKIGSANPQNVIIAERP
jgi:hypothetical protein